MKRPKNGEFPNKLEQDTAAYFGNLSGEAEREERELEELLSQSTAEIDVDADDGQ